MGAPTSAFPAEIFLQYMEHNNICKILHKNQIIGYYRYLNYILIICNINNTNIEKTLADFNNIYPKLLFTLEK
jgi:hypothetical protein